jgi:hypothetical protein
MHGHHQDITKLNLLLTEPSQVSGVGPREGRPEAQTVWLQVGRWAVRLVRFEKVRLPISHAKCDGRVLGKLPFVTAM